MREAADEALAKALTQAQLAKQIRPNQTIHYNH